MDLFTLILGLKSFLFTSVSSLWAGLGRAGRSLGSLPVKVVVHFVVHNLNEATELVSKKIVVVLEVAREAIRS